MRFLLGGCLPLLVCALQGAASSQVASGGPLEQLEQMVAQAESHLQANRPESAARLLCEACRELRTVRGADAQAKRRLEQRATALLRRADPQGQERVKVLEKTAADLEELAASYRKRGWTQTAAALLEQVEALDPGRARTQLLAMRAELSPDPNQLLFEGFEPAVAIFGDKPWNRRDEYIESPEVGPGLNRLSQALVGWHDLVGDAEIRVELKMTEHPGKVGLVIGCSEDASAFYLVEIVHGANDTSIYIRRYHDGQFELRYTSVGKLTPDVRAGYVPLSVRIEGNDICVALADMTPFHARADGPITGRIGFFVSGDTINPDPVRFRHLEVRNEWF